MHWSINTPQWLGKAVGFTCALLWAPADSLWLPVGLITGILLGHLYDLWSAGQTDPDLAGLKAATGKAEGNTATPELQFLFSAAGRVSKASGNVKQAHINRTEQLIQSLKLDTAARTQVIGWFEQGKDANAGFAALAKQCLQTGTATTRTAMVQCLCDYAVIEPTKECVAELKRLAGMLGFASGRIGQLFGEAHTRRTFRREPPNARTNQGPTGSSTKKQTTTTQEPAVPVAVRAAYTYLDVPLDSSLTITKQAYRRLVSRYHPDRLGQNPSARELSHAQRKMVELRDALETIEAYQRG